MSYIKTQLGEHDYHKPACAEFCKLGGEFCPYVKMDRIQTHNIVRWTDIADMDYAQAVVNVQNQEQTDIHDTSVGYTADFTDKETQANTFRNWLSSQTGDLSESINDEMSMAGYTCWCDGSGFEYDRMSRNVIGPGSTMESIYDITHYEIEHDALKFSRWNAWIDKFQYDYRYGRVSDTNAECVLFPNVDNPWMFTEYVFKGIGGEEGKCALTIPQEYVVEPPLYDPMTLKLVNGDMEIAHPEEDFNGKYSDCNDGNFVEQNKYSVKKYREIINWNEYTTWTLEDALGDEEKLEKLNAGNISLPVSDQGIKLYRARIPVQSVKWGEHGNIPPHTLDMTAPKSWLDPTNTVTKLKAVYDAVIGVTKDCSEQGKIEWEGNQAYVWVGMTLSEITESGHKAYTYTGGTKTELDMPTEMVRGEKKILKPTEKIMPDQSHGEYCHNGCGNLIGLNGKLYCKYIRNGSYNYESYFNSSSCLNYESYGGSPRCPGYVASRKSPIISSYQEKKIGVDQMTSNLSNVASSGMLMVAGGVGGALLGGGALSRNISNQCDKIAEYYSNLGKRGEVDISYVVRFEPVMGSDAQAQLNKTKYNQYGQGVQIVPGTGKYAFDSEKNANPFSGGDTNAYDDINTLSFHRFFTSVMHCANHKYCNEVIGQAHAQGFSIMNRAGGDDGCRYYKDMVNGVEGCPYNCAPKRGIEFAYCASAISGRIQEFLDMYNSYKEYYIWDFEAGEYGGMSTSTYSCVKIGNLDWRVFSSFAVCQRTDNVALLAVKFDNNGEAVSGNINYSPQWSGAAMLASVPNGESGDGIPQGYLLFGEFRTDFELVEVGKDGDGEPIKYKKYTATEGFYWFQPIDNQGNTLSFSENVPAMLQQHVDANGYWFCKAEQFQVPTTNCMLVDNDDKFIGGWHPEYKDYSKMGDEFMQDIVSDVSREGQGIGDYVQGQDYSPIPQPVNKKGYWIDESGLYIMDERSTGTEEAVANDDDRESNGGPGACLSFKKTNTEIDGETGQQTQPKVTNCGVYANDPYDLVITKFRQQGRPKFKDPDSDDDYVATPIINYPYLLPTMRHALHCPKCDYYLPYKYHDITNCPWCGSQYEMINGDKGIGMDAGSKWSSDASIMRKFFKIYAIGTADVWCPPGTALKTDAYFWKRQSQITNGIRKQIAHRLGDSNKNPTPIEIANGKTSGGAYKFNKMSETSEMTLGYPEGIGKFIKVPEGMAENTTTDMKYGKKYIDWKPTEDTSVDGMYNPVSPRHMVPEWYNKSDTDEEDEGVIAPYTNSSNDALKLVSYEQMRVFRNGIEPIYAYVLNDYAYDRDYPTYRASYDQREIQDQPIIFEGRRAVISPQVLASTDDGRDTYQTYFSGDLVYGNVKEYFPSGYTWWMLKNVIGGRYTLNQGGYYHLDDGGAVGNGRMEGGSGGEYTCGKRTVAKCALSIYGMLPLDKEIVRAYVIVRPSGVDPSKDPIGLSWTGGPAMYCHYHALPKDHYEDGKYRHLHGTAGYGHGEYFDEDGNFVNPHPGVIYYDADDIRYQDESAYHLWGQDSNAIEDDRELFYDARIKDTMTNIACLYDDAFHRHVGTVKISVNAYDINTGSDSATEFLGYGYDRESFGDTAGFKLYNLSNTEEKRNQKYQYVVVDDDNMLVIKYPEALVWKTNTSEEIEDTIEEHMATVEFTVSDGTEEGRVTHVFRQADSELYMNEMPKQSQDITGYFDMSWANTKGYVYDEYSVEKSTGGGKWDAPVVFQDDSTVDYGTVLKTDDPLEGDFKSRADKYSYTGGETSGQIGQVARCIDVTDIVKKLYNNRIQRTFSCDAGCTIADILKWDFYSPLKGSDTLEEIDYDVKLQNMKQDKQGDGTYLLTDTISYPKMDDVSDIPAVDSEGDKYELAEKKTEILVTVSASVTFDSSNKEYSVNIGGQNSTGSFFEGQYEGITDTLLNSLKSMFSGAEVVRKSKFKALITSDKEIEIVDCGNSCYSNIGLSVGAYYPMQNRAYEVTNYSDGYSPSTLMGTGYGLWTYDTYNDTKQSFTVDLLRAPLCKSQKDWRYQEPTDEQPGDGIMTYEYDNPFSPNPYITKITITPHQDLPTNYRVFAKPEGFRSWRSIANVVYQRTTLSNGYELRYCIDTSAMVASNTGRLVIEIPAGTLRARFVKVECDSDMVNILHQYPIFDSTGNEGGTSYQVVAHGEFSKMGMFSLEGTKAVITDTLVSDPFAGNNLNLFEIVSAQTIGEDSGKLRISLNRPAYGQNIQGLPSSVNGKYIHFFGLKQSGGISEFKVYGFHYKTEESDGAENDYESGKKFLTVTDPEDEYHWRMNTQTTIYDLPEVPTKILDISVGTSGSAGISLTETNSTTVLWETEDVEILSQEYNLDGDLIEIPRFFKRIIGGTYYYDMNEGKIHIPRFDQNGIPWNQFEDGISDTSIQRSYIPDTLTMRYWSGNGKSITFKVKADGHGPSYMVEKNAIQEISPETKAILPNNGRTGKIWKIDGNPSNEGEPIPWVCYNNRPATLSIEDQSRSNSKQGLVKFTAGEFRKPSFSGKEIGNKLADDYAFVQLFGEHCEGCRGQCETEVTLTGAPNQIISGHLTFIAKDITEREIDTGTSKVYYKERTGGIDQGIMIVSCYPASAGAGRMTLCYSVPELLIYAKEAKLFTESSGNASS